MRRCVRAGFLATIALIAVLAPGVGTAATGPPVNVGIHPAHPAGWNHLVGNSVFGVPLDIALDDPSPNGVPVRITLPLPHGWAAGCHSAIGSEIVRSCAANQRMVVVLAGPPDPGSDNTFTVVLYPASDTTDGTVTALHLHAAPVGATDSDPSDNDLVARIRMHGVADLSATLTQTATTAMVGDTVGFTLTITNAGPDPAVEPGISLDGHGMTSGRLVVDLPGAGCTSAVSGSAPDGIRTVFCQSLPNIAPRSTLTIGVRWTVGPDAARGVLHALVGDFATDPDVPASALTGAGSPLGVTQPELVARPVTVAAATPVPPLANTGVAALTLQLVAALAAMLLGAGLVWAGSPRPVRAGRVGTFRQWRGSGSPGCMH